jgi:hypothetical protein
MPTPSKYFRREGMPSDEEIVLAIRDIEVRLDEIQEPEFSKVELRALAAEAKASATNCEARLVEANELWHELKERLDALPKV